MLSSGVEVYLGGTENSSSDSKLYYCNSRYYDSETGRFINADDISYLDPENMGGLNLYAYCGNNPIMAVDPDGHNWKSFWNGVGDWFKENWDKLVMSATSVAATIGGVALMFVPGAQVLGLGLIGAGIGSIVGGITSASNGGNVFEGWAFGGLIGGAVGLLVGLAAPVLAGFLSTGGAGLAIAGGGAMSIAGVKAVGIAALLSAIVFFKGDGPRMGHNQYENKQFKDVMKKLGIKKSDPRWRKSHDALDGSISKFKDLVKFIKNYLGL